MDVFHDLISLVIVAETVFVRAKKHNCQPFCGPDGRIDCSDSMFSLRPAPLSYLCMRVRILGVLKIVCCCENKSWMTVD